ncbi:hypothetical protein PPSIR1_34487 [Plesiocystis pacifica SIR-1]|uniref:Uncharacterized protein n=1 Tax=Plesiocystis pacifica SIR-1 TaxID=391625 RepID=A6G7Q5_9BACT|nr:hypothetical protein [Plesiocystis pacifica]EDM78133.1 hypothetical protein PPSIR1_34487 [Plesiocystis pacifica SIR-1]
MSDALTTIDQAMAALGAAESELETALASLNPVTHRGQIAQINSQLSSMRDDVRDVERKRGRVTAESAVATLDPADIQALAEASATLAGLAGKGEKVDRLLGAVGGALSAAKSALAAV